MAPDNPSADFAEYSQFYSKHSRCMINSRSEQFNQAANAVAHLLGVNSLNHRGRNKMHFPMRVLEQIFKRPFKAVVSWCLAFIHVFIHFPNLSSIFPFKWLWNSFYAEYLILSFSMDVVSIISKWHGAVCPSGLFARKTVRGIVGFFLLKFGM